MDIGAFFIAVLLVIVTAIFLAVACVSFSGAFSSFSNKENGRAAGMSLFGLISSALTVYFAYQLFTGLGQIGFESFWSELKYNDLTRFALIIGIALGVSISALVSFIKKRFM